MDVVEIIVQKMKGVFRAQGGGRVQTARSRPDGLQARGELVVRFLGDRWG